MKTPNRKSYFYTKIMESPLPFVILKTVPPPPNFIENIETIGKLVVTVIFTLRYYTSYLLTYLSLKKIIDPRGGS